jgi:hypothetical protein
MLMVMRLTITVANIQIFIQIHLITFKPRKQLKPLMIST